MLASILMATPLSQTVMSPTSTPLRKHQRAAHGRRGRVPAMIWPQHGELWAWQLLHRVQDAFVLPTHALVPGMLAPRLRTGAIGEELYDEPFTVLVTREWPLHLRERDVDAWWPMLAPSRRLLRTRRGPHGERMPWMLFVARYWAELSALPHSLQDSYVVRLGTFLQKYPSVTLLSSEPSKGRAEAEIRSQRRVLHSWLLEG
jgi:uncharacterized protein YeaO (DUF488 family)